MQQLAERVYTLIGSIPHGKVASYGQIAALAGYPNHARKVGQLLRQLPEGSTLPWHRVVNSQRRISFPEGSQKFAEQKQKLQAEGVVFSARNLIPSHYLWN